MDRDKGGRMLNLANDFKDESEALYQMLEPLDEAALFKPTRFKSWTSDDVIGHLHLWNVAADLSFEDEAGFDALMADLLPKIMGGKSHQEVTTEWLDGLRRPRRISPPCSAGIRRLPAGRER